MGWLGAGLGLISSLIGGNQQNHAQQQATDAASQAAKGQNDINQQQLKMYQDLLNRYNQGAGSLDPGMTGIYGGLQSGLGNQAGNNMQHAANYFMHPDQTMGGVNGIGGLGEAYNLAEAQNGIDPSVISNAYNKQHVSQERSINDIRHSLGSATPNIAGTIRDLGEQGMTADAQLGSNLAGMNQQFRDQGMSKAMGIAGGIDQQTGSMLQTGSGMSSDALSQIMQYINSTRPNTAAIGQGYSGIANQYANAGSQAAQNAANIHPSNPFSFLANYGANHPDLFAGIGGHRSSGNAAQPESNPYLGGGGGGYGDQGAP